MDACKNDEVERLRAEVAALRELLNVYNLGGWTDAEGPMKRAIAAEAERDRLRELLREARAECVVYMAGGMTHAGWKTDRAKKLLDRIDAELGIDPAIPLPA